MRAPICSSAEQVGRRYDRWLSSSTPEALYVRWYLRRRRPAEYLRLLDALPGQAERLLDVGCATGIGLEAAFNRGHGSVLLAGVDVSERALAEARRRVARLQTAEGVSPRVVLERADAAHLPFDDGDIDTVTCNGLVKYLDDAALARALAEMARVLRAGGALALGEFGPRLAGAAPAWWRVRRIEDEHLRGADTLGRSLAAAGFSAINEVEVPRIRRFPYAYVGMVARRGR